MSQVHLHDHAPTDVETALAEEWERNCNTVASASEDLHHQNLARMALLKENRGVEVAGFDLLNLKVELLVEELCGGDALRRLMIGFLFQQRLADHLAHLEE